jgi:pimeloyl-ACP methyl ester carboxylesterase
VRAQNGKIGLVNIEDFSTTIDLDGPINTAHMGDSGDAMLLVHGIGGSNLDWMGVVEELAKTNRVYAPDLIGFGRTPLKRRNASLESNTKMLARYIKEVIGEPVVLVGNSMGGLLAMVLASKHPELVKKLVLVCPASWLPYNFPDKKIAALFLLSLRPVFGSYVMHRLSRDQKPEEIVKLTLNDCCFDASAVTPEVVAARVRLEIERLQSQWSYIGFMQAWRSILVLLGKAYLFDKIAKSIKVPTLLIQGEADKVISVPAVKRLSKLRPDWEFSLMEHWGHAPQIDKPLEFLRVLGDWMKLPEPATLLLVPDLVIE